MQFKTLFKKNFIYWKRNYKASIAEIVTPLLLALLLILLRKNTTVTTATEGSSPALPLLTSMNDLDSVPLAILRSTMKNCTVWNKGGSIGLAPSFEITQKLATYFQKLNYTALFFDSNDKIDEWIRSDSYLDVLPDGTRKQLCLAIVFNKYGKLDYDYSLRYNLTGNPANTEHLATNAKTFQNEYKAEDLEQYVKLLSNGVLTLQGLIDGMIFQRELQSTVRIKIEKMRNPEYIQADYTSALSAPFIITLAAAGLISFVRFISHIVTERERRNIENMENMGMNKFLYLLSIYCFNLLVQFFIAILFSIIIKLGVFKSVNFLILFLTYFMFIFAFMTIASVISCFFVHAKKAIITGLIVYLFLFMFWILRDSVAPTETPGTTGIALSPMGGLAQLVTNFIVFENSSYWFGFPSLQYEINAFRGQTYFIILLIEIVIFFWLGAYLFFVVPLKIGIAKHPLFIFGYPWGKKKVEHYDFIPHEESKQNSPDFPPENFENVEEELKQQSKSNQTISINRLTKVYSKNKIAVDNLSLEIYRDQIFALLGHNGAGKTTTISMISGLLPKTKGDVKIMGLDLVRDREQIKKNMGICPQTNPIFNYLTVYEHLELYARIKGVAGEINSEIDELLNDIDLFHKKNYIAGNLSGGQKRKLCVAISLIGKSKVILLDEPTSGMDTYARRHLWEMLKKYKKDRIIILTTHNMDEADYLGDRIGIMSSGKLVTCGSSLFLKNRFGDGYELVILKNPESSSSPTHNVKELVSAMVPDAKFLSEIGSEIKYRLPQQSANFHTLFKKLEDQGSEYGVQSFGITLATLEDVFIKVANIKIEDDPSPQIARGNFETPNPSDSSKVIISNKEVSRYDNGIEHEIKDKDLQGLRLQSNAQVFRLQMKALIRKRFLFFSRDISGIVCEIFLPIIIVIIGLGITKISFVKDFPVLPISPALYPNDNAFFINQREVAGESISNALLSYFPNPPYAPSVVNPQSLSDLDMMVFKNRTINQLYAYFVEAVTPGLSSYTVLFNSTAPFAPYLAINSMNNAILKYISKNDSASIKMSLNPLGVTSNVKSIEDTIDGFIVVMLIALAFSFVPSSLILYIIKERENNAKHQQIISGVNVLAYWLSNLIVDYAKYIIPAMASYALFFIFDVKFFITGANAGMSFLLFFLYGFTMIGYTYVASFWFRKPSAGQIFIFIFCFFTSFVLLIVMFSLKLIVETRDVARNVLDYIFRLIPSFSFPYGFLMMANMSLFSLIFKWPKDITAFDVNVSLLDIIYIPCIGLLTYATIFVIEFWFIIRGKFKRSNIRPNVVNDMISRLSDNDTVADADVKQEEDMVRNHTKHFSVRVQDLWKVYPLKSSANNSGRGINYKAAVKGISFGVEQGMVFSLLGTNGAGKTSTFKVLTGDTVASYGEATIMGFEMPKDLIEIRHLVGYCPQFDSILSNLTAQEHLELYAHLKGIDPKYHEALIENMLETMNLTRYRNVLAGTYSGGNKRKLNVAIALLGRPPIVFLDEPSSGMDPEARRFMWNVINDISTKRKHSSVVLTTHSMEEAEALSTKIAIMVEGKIKTIGSVQQLKSKYGKGFELDIKLSIPSDTEVLNKKNSIRNRIQLRKENELSAHDVHQVLELENLVELEKEIAPNKKGSAIFKRLELNKVVEISLVIEWIILSKKLRKVEEWIKTRFSAIILESFQSYIRFKISEEHKLSDIFQFMDQSKLELEVDTYTVRQISLEQIFIQFAQDIQHDD